MCAFTADQKESVQPGLMVGVRIRQCISLHQEAGRDLVRGTVKNCSARDFRRKVVGAVIQIWSIKRPSQTIV